MSTMIVATAVLAVVNILFKAAGPAVLGEHPFPDRARTVVDALPVALLAALLTVDLLGPGWRDADWTLLPGLSVGVALRAWRRPHLVCIAAAVVCTAVVRLLLHVAG